MNKSDLINGYRIPYATMREYIFFKQTFIKTNHMLIHKPSLNKVLKLESIQTTLESQYKKIPYF